MSYEAICTLPRATRPRSLIARLAELGYVKEKISPFWHGGALCALSWHETRDYRSHVGIYLEVVADQKGLGVYLRSNIDASYWDLRKLNETIRAVRRQFHGTFRSDHGPNRYFPLPDRIPSPSESGCELAFSRFESAVSRAELYLANCRFPDHFRRTPFADILSEYSPWVLSNNFFCHTWSRSSRITSDPRLSRCSKYSPRKEKVLKAARLNANQLARISAGEASVEEAVAEKCFQNLKSVSDQLRDLVAKLDVHGLLRRPYRRRKTSLWESLTDLIERRHAFVHTGRVHADFSDELLGRGLMDAQVSVDRVYRRLCELSSWPAPYRKIYRLPPMQLSDEDVQLETRPTSDSESNTT